MAERPDFEAVLDHYEVAYKPGKLRQKILCPVHEEHVPSCSIDLTEGLYNCHACNSAGDAFNLIMEKERCDFATAQRVAEGITASSGRPVRTANDTGSAGLFGRTRPEHRNGKRVPYRARIFPDGRT